MAPRDHVPRLAPGQEILDGQVDPVAEPEGAVQVPIASRAVGEARQDRLLDRRLDPPAPGSLGVGPSRSEQASVERGQDLLGVGQADLGR